MMMIMMMGLIQCNQWYGLNLDDNGFVLKFKLNHSSRVSFNPLLMMLWIITFISKYYCSTISSKRESATW